MEPTPRTATPIALTIAGSDSSGAAGLQSDLRAFDALGVHGTSVVTLVTAQGSRRFRKMDALRADLVRAQLAAVTEPVAPRAVKVGALGNAAVVEIVADVLRALRDAPLVLDPVISPRDGRVLLDDSGYASFVRELLPLATLILPNRDEAARLAGAAVKTPAADAGGVSGHRGPRRARGAAQGRALRGARVRRPVFQRQRLRRAALSCRCPHGRPRQRPCRR
ncbi:MAG: hydroxymethylpyrimidine/phosphomethylpyrimidine kinase [Polyangiales bacterium]